jgi:hypothetical protein
VAYLTVRRFLTWCGVKKRVKGAPKPRCSIREFAEYVGVDERTVLRWIDGKAEPDRRSLRCIHRFQTQTGAVRQRELFEDSSDDATLKAAMREGRARLVEMRRKAELAEAMRLVEIPVDEEQHTAHDVERSIKNPGSPILRS